MVGHAVYQPTLRSQTLGHYCIVEEIGAGGMGVVYRAHDQHLDRDVAIKVLSPGTLAGEGARKRFRKEAHSLSKLNHPNIATVYDFDTQDDIDYLVMEYVPGKTLRDSLAQGPLIQEEVIRLGAQLANGLAAAHDQGLVHRDLKPENVRLTLDGMLKILDFGLAKLAQPLGDARTTESNISAVVGTLPYMSPEQASGGVVGQCADLFSFGVVLYEMATGQHPFAEVEVSRLMAAILCRQPMPPTRVNSKVSPELERIILKCLEKEPGDRYQSANEVAVDLRVMGRDSSVKKELATALRPKDWRARIVPIALFVGVLLLVGGVHFRSRIHALTQSDSIVLADYVNSTHDPVFDDTLNQALMVELEQSPFLKVLPQAKMRETLQLMGRPAEESLTPEVGRELCQRVGAKAVLWGSIASLGSQYVIGLTANECNTGNQLASAQVQCANKEAVLKGLGEAASRLRSRLGESFSSVQNFDTPLEEATTPSLEALKAYSLARRTEYQKGSSASIPFFQRAIELDPNFAVAYSGLGIAYSNLGEISLANEKLQRAYELRDRVSEREKLRIAASYYSYVRGDLVKGSEIYELWAQTYPRDGAPTGNLGAINLYLGQYDKALSNTRDHLRLEPDDALGYGNLMVGYSALNRIDQAKTVYKEAIARKLEDLSLHGNLYGIAFLENDQSEMDRQIAWATGKPGAEDVLLSFASDTEAYYGRLSEARTLSLRAINSAIGRDQRETAAGWRLNAALREAEVGNISQARKAIASALALASTRDAQVLAALALARAGVSIEAQKLAEDLAKHFPRDTLINGYWIPTIKAAIEIDRNNPATAIDLLQTTVSYELGEPYPLFQAGGSLYPIYLRAQSYLLLNRAADAAAEFQRILDHRGIVVNCPIGALARLGLARAYAIQSDTIKSRSSYQDFLTLWKDADPEIPIYKEAKAEYAKLQ